MTESGQTREVDKELSGPNEDTKGEKPVISTAPLVTGFLEIIPIFTGLAMDSLIVQDFFETLEVSESAGWKDQTKNIALQARLKGAALDLMPKLRRAYGRDYEKLKNGLTRSFRWRTARKGNCLDKFISLREGKGEGVSEFLVRVELAFVEVAKEQCHLLV